MQWQSAGQAVSKEKLICADVMACFLPAPHTFYLVMFGNTTNHTFCPVGHGTSLQVVSISKAAARLVQTTTKHMYQLAKLYMLKPAANKSVLLCDVRGLTC